MKNHAPSQVSVESTGRVHGISGWLLGFEGKDPDLGPNVPSKKMWKKHNTLRAMQQYPKSVRKNAACNPQCTLYWAC